MPAISKLDFQQWKSSPVTEAFLSACQDQLKSANDSLIQRAGLDSNDDNFYRGYIRAYLEVMDLTLEDVVEESE